MAIGDRPGNNAPSSRGRAVNRLKTKACKYPPPTHLRAPFQSNESPKVLVVEYSPAAGVRTYADRLRLWLGGWSDRDLIEMLHASRGSGEDKDVKEEREKVCRAMARASEGGVVEGEQEEEEVDTVLISDLTKVGSDVFES